MPTSEITRLSRPSRPNCEDVWYGGCLIQSSAPVHYGFLGPSRPVPRFIPLSFLFNLAEMESEPISKGLSVCQQEGFHIQRWDRPADGQAQ